MSSPSAIHEGIVSLFRNCPDLAPKLLRAAAKHSLPEFTRVEIGSENLTAIKPVEFRADGVTLLVHSARVFGIVVEVQLAIDGRKRYTWPAYVTNLRAQHEIPVALLVVTPYLAVAKWAKEPIHLGQGSTITPAVIGPDEVPVISDIAFSERSPELAVLSAMAHGDLEPRVSAAAALSALDALDACSGVPEDRLVLYSDLIISSLGQAARITFEAIMEQKPYEFQSDLLRRFYEKAEAQGEARGEARGEAQGMAHGRVDSLLVVLAARGLSVSAEQQVRIRACNDIATLNQWLQRAVLAASVDELFQE